MRMVERRGPAKDAIEGKVYGFLKERQDASVTEMVAALNYSKVQIEGALYRLRMDHGFNIENVSHGSGRFTLNRTGT